MTTVNYEDLAQSRFAEDLKAVAAPAISNKELTDSFNFYGVKPKGLANQTDSQLYKKATNDVLAWWKRVKGQGYYQTTTAGKPYGSSGNRPPQAATPQFGRAYMDQTRKQYGLLGVAVPEWATRNQNRFEQWLSVQLRRKGLTL